jgi:hypothetical protein
MKASYWFLGVIAILMWNGVLIKRDQELFKAYDKVCAELSQPHPNCHLSK